VEESQAFLVMQIAVQMHHFSGCDVTVLQFEVHISIWLLSQVGKQYFLKVFWEQFLHSAEVASPEAIIHILKEDDKHKRVMRV
jgi:hypothetical protein